MSVQEQAVQMIHSLSEDNVRYLIDFMKRFMLPKEDRTDISLMENVPDIDLMQEMEAMRIKAKSYFPSEFDSDKIWEEAMEERYGSVN